MPKLLSGYVDNGNGVPLANITATVRTVATNGLVRTGVTDNAGHWSFAGLPEADEYFVTLEDGLGQAVVRGPWSGELREAWVRDRLAVAGLPVTVSPDAGNALEWRPTGLWAAAGAGGGYTAAQSDSLFVDIAGDTMTGPLNLTAGGAGMPSLAAAGDPNTGIYFPAPDRIAFTAGGITALGATALGPMTDRIQAATSVSGFSGVLPWYSSAGVLIGYMPIFSSYA